MTPEQIKRLEEIRAVAIEDDDSAGVAMRELIAMIDELQGRMNYAMECEAAARADKATIEKMAWNLAGCLTIAESQKPAEFNQELALPALNATNRMVAGYEHLQSENAALRQDAKRWRDHVYSISSRCGNCGAAKPPDKPCDKCGRTIVGSL